MEKLERLTGVAAVLDAANVDTDQIIPKQFLKRVERGGFGQFLFYNWRFKPDGEADPGFVLNQPRYAGASMLVARENFGSGSSREHAPWALRDYGFRALIAPSFADIFRNNCRSIGLLTIELDAETVQQWFERIGAQEGYEISLDLPAQTLTGSDGYSSGFDIDPEHKTRLVEGLDSIGITLKAIEAIMQYEQKNKAPWRAAVSKGCLE